jgi:RNA polymerase sigma-70 factor (ECF subfamily)
MFFRNSEKQTVLNLDADGVRVGELTAGIIASSQPNLSTEDKVKLYFEQLREPVFRYLTATFGGERLQAEEITQDAFLQLYRSMSDGQAIQNVRAWTFRVAHNLAVNRIRRRQFIAPLTEEEWEELQQSVVAKDLNPEQNLLQKEKLDRLRKAISRLTTVERECLNLRTKGFRYREIGEILEISARSVANTLYRVIEKLAKETNG